MYYNNINKITSSNFNTKLYDWIRSGQARCFQNSFICVNTIQDKSTLKMSTTWCLKGHIIVSVVLFYSRGTALLPRRYWTSSVLRSFHLDRAYSTLVLFSHVGRFSIWPGLTTFPKLVRTNGNNIVLTGLGNRTH